MKQNWFPSSAQESLEGNDFNVVEPTSKTNLRKIPSNPSPTRPKDISKPKEESSGLKVFGFSPFSLFTPITSPTKKTSFMELNRKSAKHSRTTSDSTRNDGNSSFELFNKFVDDYRQKEEEIRKLESMNEEEMTPKTRSRSHSQVTRFHSVLHDIQVGPSPNVNMRASIGNLPVCYTSAPGKMDPKLKQKVVVIKYYEEKAKFAKIIPRNMTFLKELRAQVLNQELKEIEDDTHLEAEVIFYMIKNDAKWLSKISPIKTVLFFDEKKNDLQQVEPKQTFDIGGFGEIILTFHIIRETKPTKLMEETTMLFEDISKAKKKVDELTNEVRKEDGTPSCSVRYYDLPHHAYVKLVKGDVFPISRFGTSQVKILVERIIYEKETTEDDFIFIDQSKVDIVHNRENSFEKYVDFSQYVDKNKLPLQDHIRSDLEETRVLIWEKLKTPTNDKDLVNLKINIRLGIPFPCRKKVYLVASGASKVSNLEDQYLSKFTKVFGTFYKKKDLKPSDVTPSIFPEFGGKLEYSQHYLTKGGFEAVKRILCCVASHCEVEYCPMLVIITCLLIKIMEESEVYACLINMLETSKKDAWWFRTKKLTNQLFLEAFKDIIKKNLATITKHFEKLDFDLEDVANSWMNNFFIGVLPFDIIWRILDSYMNEGLKVLLRAAYSLLKMLEKDILACKTKTDLVDLFSKPLTSFDEEIFFRFKYKVPIKRRHIEWSDNKNRSVIPPNKLEYSVTMYTRPKVKDESEIIFHENHWEVLCSWLPYKKRLQSLCRVFTTSKDGYGLIQLYNSMKDVGSVVILITGCPLSDVDDVINKKKKNETRELTVKDKDLVKRLSREEKHGSRSGSGEFGKKKFIIGAFLGESLEKSYQYEGTADSFVFSLYPKDSVFKWTKKNDYFAYGASDVVRIGGGGDGPALQFDENLQYGSSQRCQTFGNEPLLGEYQHFMILKLEVYKFE